MAFTSFTSCKTDIKHEEAVFMADIQTPMGWNYLKIYTDNTFQFEQNKLLNKIIYSGKVEIKKDTLKFEYKDAVPDFGDVAIIDGIFLTYTNGIYRELLEIKVNTISE